MDYRALFASVRVRPQMYGVPNTFEGCCAFVYGVDAGREWRFLTGFGEFLVARAGYGTNLAWPGLVWHIAFPGHTHRPAGHLDDPERQRHVIATLFDLLDEFLAVRDADGQAVAGG